MFLFGKKDDEGISGQLEIDLIMSARKAIERTAEKKINVKLVDKPKILQKPVVMWQNKMKVCRPTDCVYVSAIVIETGDPKNKGIAILFIPEEVAEFIATASGVPFSEGYDGVMRACGEFLNDVLERFKGYLQKLGYQELNFSQPQNFSSRVDQLFDYNRLSKFEMTFFRNKSKFVQLELGIGSLKKK
ncbi:MAG: hypothetical protein PHY73_05060 [Candidatus Omnitrophica bacterium]|nr:hypothetical protein [Candidatus Omnitrophota bacterium]